MVAVRSAGLALGAIIGYSIEPPTIKEREEDLTREEEIKVRSMVTEEYLGVLVRLANERFEANRERMRRFEEGLLGRGGVELEGKDGRKGDVENEETRKGEMKWEDKETRRARKRAEGLTIKEAMNGKRRHEEKEKYIEEEIGFMEQIQ